MNAETLASLSPEEQKEVWAFEKQFIKAVRNTKLGDGFAFARRFHIKQEAGYNVCSDGTSSLPGLGRNQRDPWKPYSLMPLGTTEDREKPNPEGCVRTERSGAVNPPVGEQSRSGPESPHQPPPD
jgi:hypothetical protein